MKYDIFISYRRTDRELVAQVVRRLDERGVGAWYDAEIEGGADWREVIVESLSNSDMLVIFFSDDCNNSKQLKKELAVADQLNKAVVPILIEDTQPRGAYLYELADRNWIQAWPDPVGKIDELVEHLVALAGKSEGGLAGKAALEAPSHRKAASDMQAGGAAAPAPPPAFEVAASQAAAPVAAAAPQAPGDLSFGDSIASKRAAPKLSDAYVGKVSQKNRNVPTRDILPFKWLDLIFLVPALVGFYWLAMKDGTFADTSNPLIEPISIGLLAMAMIGLFGALVFPVRYYMRRRPVGLALVKYLISSLILYGLLVGAFTAAWSQGLFPNDKPSAVAIFFGAIWGVFTVIAFVIYGILSAQRALRSFRSNIKKL